MSRVEAEPCGSRRMLENGNIADSDDTLSNMEEERSAETPQDERSPFDFTITREKRGPLKINVSKLFGSDKTLLMTATTKSSMFSTKYHIISQPSGILLAEIESDWKSLKYRVSSPKEHLFDIIYSDNFMGKNGCRSMTVKLGDSTFITKPPLPINGGYYQNFHSKDATASIKNFVLVDKKDFSKEVCVLSRMKNGSFQLKINDPVTPFHAFCISVTSFHTGLFHR